MFQRIENCPSCGSTELSNHMIVQDHFFSKESFHLSKCTQCSLIFTNPIPSESRLSYYYETENYLSHHDSNSALGLVYKFLRHINTKYKADIVRKEHSTAKKLLDFGCGTGTFLEHIRNHYACCGVELNEEARKITEIKGFPVYASIKEINASTRFDLITLWHVLEHIQPIHETIDLLRKHLAKDGIMIIAIPNVLSWDCQHFQEKWAAYDVPRHLYHFSSESLKKLLRSHRIRIRNQYPLKMDSFYISLQSLKFQGKGFSPIRAVLYGLQSNRKGGITGDFSSNIYICEKY